jgi:Haem-degrading
MARGRRPPSKAVGGSLIPVPGGLLIRGDNKQVIWAIGVTGDTSDHDGATAVAGLAAAHVSELITVRETPNLNDAVPWQTSAVFAPVLPLDRDDVLIPIPAALHSSVAEGDTHCPSARIQFGERIRPQQMCRSSDYSNPRDAARDAASVRVLTESFEKIRLT